LFTTVVCSVGIIGIRDWQAAVCTAERAMLSQRSNTIPNFGGLQITSAPRNHKHAVNLRCMMLMPSCLQVLMMPSCLHDADAILPAGADDAIMPA
jgi:hypothetical protein